MGLSDLRREPRLVRRFCRTDSNATLSISLSLLEQVAVDLRLAEICNLSLCLRFTSATSRALFSCRNSHS